MPVSESGSVQTLDLRLVPGGKPGAMAFSGTRLVDWFKVIL